MPKTIMLVADSINSIQKPLTFLSTMGFRTRVCTEATQVPQFARDLKPDLVICDDDLIESTGPQIAQEFHSDQTLNSIPVVMLARRISRERDEASTGNGVAATIPKPIDPMNLYNTISNVLEMNSVLEAPQDVSQLTPPIGVRNRDKHGQINHISVGRVFYQAHVHNATGVLELAKNRRFMTVGFEKGIVRKIDSNYLRTDSLGRMLVRHGIITQNEHETSLERAKQINCRQGEALVAMNIIDRDDLKRELYRQKVGKVYAVCGSSEWVGGEFNWQAKSHLDLDDYPLNVPAVKLLRNCILRHMKVATLIEIFKRKKLEHALIEVDGSFEQVIHVLELPETMSDLAHDMPGHTIMELNAHGAAGEDGQAAVRLAFLMAMCHGIRIGDRDDNADSPSPMIHDIPIAPEIPTVEKPVWPSEYEDTLQLMERAENHFKEGDYRSALQFVNKINDANPGHAQMLSLLGAIVLETGGYDDAVGVAKAKELLTESIHIDPKDVRAHYYLGLVYKSEKKDSMASRHFQAVLRIQPDHEYAGREIQIIEMHHRPRKGPRYRM
ncbi:hypothetical protein KDL45_08025 [bacterium]|nr:hypothetical protein [bacterium]